MKTNKICKILMIFIAIMLCIPSIMYIVRNGTVDGFNCYFSYNLQKNNNEKMGIINYYVFISFITIFSILYLVILKEEKNIFKNKKEIFLFILIISFIFILMLPIFSSDIFYYIGDSWIASKYEKNPYYTTVEDLQRDGINDEILSNTGYWKNTVSVYGPLWNSISKLLVSFSFGNVTIALFIFKITFLLVHLINCYLIYKITQDNKYVLMYGINPLILIELLSNVHNDIFLLLFIYLALFFLIKQKNIFFMTIFIAMSIAIKYTTVLLVPFILIYYFKDYKLLKRISFCFLSGISIIGIVIILYMPYYRDITVFTNMLVQGTKYSQSLMLIALGKLNNNTFKMITDNIMIVFGILYLAIIIKMLLQKELKIEKMFKGYNAIMLFFIFIVLTNFQTWYISWLIPTIFWQSKNMQNFILMLTITERIPTYSYFKVGNDIYYYGICYSLRLLEIAILITIILFFIFKKQNTEKLI